MCGIALILAPDLDAAGGPIERMTACLAHRGPDAEGYAHLNGCHLGHRRLNIIDPAGGAQPMTEETRRYWIVFNGEIFNFRELRADLKQRGHAFRTSSDTEVLLRAYAHFGENVPSVLNGQFAFAIWDKVEQRLFLARDRLGEKPLYWAVSPEGHLLVASEIKALLASGFIRPQLDLVSVDAYLGLWYVPPNRTIYENIRTLAPGHAMTWQRGCVRDWPYWQPSFGQRTSLDEAEAVDRIRELIAQAVRRQTVADVPVGAFLSGGLDSSTIVALLARDARGPVTTFAVGFGNLINELPYAAAVARDYRTDHHEIQMQINVGDMLERLAEVYDEPLADSSSIPTYLISEFARRHVKVVLSGDGGDELFGGYEWYRAALRSDAAPGDALSFGARWLAALPFRAINLAARRQLAMGRPIIRAFVESRNARRFPDAWDRHLAVASDLWSDRAAWWRPRRQPDGTAVVRQAFRPNESMEPMDRIVDFDARSFLPGDILVKVDRAAMAHGLETRCPFLDVDLVEFVWSLPWRLRFNDNRLKHLLRASCEGLWPAALRARGKQGFGAPVAHWLRRPDIRRLFERVMQPDSPLTAVLPGLARAKRRLKPQQGWTVLCLGLWLEKHSECLRNLS